jgi:UDP-N-acetylmuramate--alanine ligase
MIKIGIIFGGPSREREISFAGGRTVYDNLNKSLFEPVPIFVDSLNRFILLDWQYIYKGTIRDFYPPVEHCASCFPQHAGAVEAHCSDDTPNKFGRQLRLDELPQVMDMAFLCLHGLLGEDGQIQGFLEMLGIPYTGSGIRPSTIGMSKAFQKKIMSAGGFAAPQVEVLHRAEWFSKTPEEQSDFYKKAQSYIGFPMVIRPANQGSSIGVKILSENEGLAGFQKGIDAAFFAKRLTLREWRAMGDTQQLAFAEAQTDIRNGLGYPLGIASAIQVNTPKELLETLSDLLFDEDQPFFLEGQLSEESVLLEAFIKGREFSCIVVRLEDGRALALPPTEIVKGGEVFDYRSKYLPGLSRKVTPIGLPYEDIQRIRKECERLFNYLEFNVYARIDGFIQADGTIFLNDPNTTSGMLPASFFFHQAAEIGLNPSQFLTYIIYTSLKESIDRACVIANKQAMLARLRESIRSLRQQERSRRKIAVIMGGYSFERHISVESGRNVFEKLASSDKYEPLPIFLIGNEQHFELYQIPVNLLLKDNADDIRDKILHYETHRVVEEIKQEAASITDLFASRNVVFSPKKLSPDELPLMVDGVFIAIHGRPGEDGNLQQLLDKLGLPYNGSDPVSSGTTINKYDTLQILNKNGFEVTNQYLTYKKDYLNNKPKEIALIEAELSYPFIAKPVDDGCSSAVKVLRSREQLVAFLETMYREEEAIAEGAKAVLKLKFKEEFPRKDAVLLERLITRDGAAHFLEITGGLMTRFAPDGSLQYEMFEPSEALALGEVLSLEEKFLAGEGMNITPARFAPSPNEYERIAARVKADLERAARVLGVQGYARIDAFVRVFQSGEVQTIIIEVNSLPGMTPATCIFHQAALNGYKPYEFIDAILEFGFDRINNKN